MIPVQLIVAGVLVASSFGAGWFIQENRYEKQLSDLHAEQSVALAAATASALSETVRLQEKLNAAERVAVAKQLALARDLARTRATANGLRGDLETARSALPSATCSSVREYATTVSTVFDECRSALVEMAGNAQGHAADALKLSESWP